MASDFIKQSYKIHEDNFLAYKRGEAKEETAKTWLQDDNVNAWCAQRIYATIDPLLQAYPEATWLTVGDGRYGNDAHYIHSKGGKVLATDISDHLLKEAVDLGRIAAYKKEYAEALSFAAEEFDFIFCKESYHHFPRPMIALYEMLRVSRKGVVLLEPQDTHLA
jgi:ubiquinone/menaquinone biosynthesis C-methylase UbiE